MAEEKKKFDCYTCKYRGGVFYSCHSSCKHPNISSLNIKGKEHGIKKGWFFFPSNFDPIWLENCDGYEAKEKSPIPKNEADKKLNQS